MTSLSRAKEIADILASSEAWRSKGRVAVATASAILAGIPFAGGPLQVLCEKVGGALVDPKLEEKFVELCRLLAELEPEINRIDDLQKQISVIAAAFSANQSLLKRAHEVVENLHQRTVDAFGAKTVGSRQDFVNVTIKDMNVLIEAHQSGINYLKNVRTKGGSVQFGSTTGGYQKVEDSTFTGRSGSAVGLHNLSVGGRVSTLGKQAGIALGPRGSIGFGPGGQLSFGAPKKK